MCGIVGYIGKQPAKDILLEGLKRLEYRGYDSAGLAVLQNQKVKSKNKKLSNKILVVKAVGKVEVLEEKLKDNAVVGTVGIAHTRWATHGKPSEKNAHPHTDCTGTVAIVHNGIIENYHTLKEELIGQGHKFRSETDSEVAAHLIEEAMKKVSFGEAFLKTLKRLKGTYGIVALSATEPGKILVARLGSPLVIGVGKEEYFIASDVSAMLRYTQQVIYLEDGEVGAITEKEYTIKTLDNRRRTKETVAVEWSDEEAQKGGFAHFMLKEIYECPETLVNATRGRLMTNEGLAKLGGIESIKEKLRTIERLVIVACGTASYAACVGEYMLEEYAGIPVEVDIGSEFRYRKAVLDKQTAVIVISQSGETADTLAAVREAKEKGILVLSIVNVVGSTIARETGVGIYSHAGPEISVASTKAFISQLAILSLLTIFLGRQRQMSLTMGKRLATGLEELPKLMQKIFDSEKHIKALAKKYKDFDHMAYLGRKYNFPLALEGALKLKETAYIHAEGSAGGEFKHGPIAMIDKHFPCFFIAPVDSVYEKTKSNIEELAARQAPILAITTLGNTELKRFTQDIIYIPKTLEMLTPFLVTLPLYLFAYHVAVLCGNDVDRPRNLAKSVTVE